MQISFSTYDIAPEEGNIGNGICIQSSVFYPTQKKKTFYFFNFFLAWIQKPNAKYWQRPSKVSSTLKSTADGHMAELTSNSMMDDPIAYIMQKFVTDTTTI